MTRDQAKKLLYVIKFMIPNEYYTDIMMEAVDMAIHALEQEPKIEQEIRKEIKRLSTYRVCTDTTDLISDLVSVNAVERVLNLVFRGCRDKEPQVESEDVDTKGVI